MTAIPAIETVPRLKVEAAESFNYAAWQNAVPLLHGVTIDNSDGPEVSALAVELKASPAFAREKRWTIDRVAAGETLTLRHIDLDVDPAFLDALDEAERGVLTFRLVHKGDVLHEAHHTLRVLARDEWGGMSAMGELLPAFVTPNDPALAAVLRSAADVLGRHGHPTALDGYQSGDPNRAYLLAASLWSAVAGPSLVYANPPGSFEQVGQKTRPAGTVLGDGLATCLDTSLLFASCLEAAGLNPVLVMTAGHCFAGVWLVKKSFKKLVEPDCGELRKAIAAKELVVFETTLVTHCPPAGFPDAMAVATAAVSEEKEHEFVAVVDVSRARMSQVRPLASRREREDVVLDDAESGPPPLPAALKRPSRSIREMIGGMPETFGKLAPCLLMSPLSIAQYLPAGQAQFDVVVFDEASQIADRVEPTAVKNLENVQGDERDVMMFSITFGFDAAGKFPIDFGAINRDGGERRLNVAVTRARQELIVYASFLPEQLRAERSAARGVRDLKAFLEYADKGPEAIAARTDGSSGDAESPLEEAVAAALEERGWRVDPQVGVSGFRIDLGVVHPDRPGAYLAGVECDGATYHRSAVARDRDKIRQQVLENLGWAIVRVWSTDWWYDPEAAIEQMSGALDGLLRRSREEAADVVFATLDASEGEAGAADAEFPGNPTAGFGSGLPAVADAAVATADGPAAECAAEPQLVAKHATREERRFYGPVALPDATSNQDRFFDEGYSDQLRTMALSILESHGPIRDDVLAREVARAHGFARTVNRIKQRVLDLLPGVTVTEESAGTFLWPGPAAQESVPFRYPADDGVRRSLDEIAMPELIGLVREHPGLAAGDDPALALSREIGLARLARAARERLEEALEACGGRL